MNLNNNPPSIDWVKIDKTKDYCLHDGSEFLLAVLVKNNKTQKATWQINAVHVCSDERDYSFFYKDTEDAYTSFVFLDHDYYFLLSGRSPEFIIVRYYD